MYNALSLIPVLCINTSIIKNVCSSLSIDFTTVSKMNLVQIISLFLIIISAFCNRISSAEFESAHAVQIISPTNNHSFELKLNEINKILHSDDIKDRNVVVVSIAGAFRQGKSFLLNFFVKYLNAQVKKNTIEKLHFKIVHEKIIAFHFNSTKNMMSQIGWVKRIAIAD